jgi:hypothetical protein
MFGATGEAEIRISFAAGGSWSFVGKECLGIPQHEPTMNYGWLAADTPPEELRAVVLHEFGHALGCVHEHQHPEAGIKWKKPEVYAFYAGEPNYWTPEEVDRNVFQVYDGSLTVHTQGVDPTSIMMYSIDPRLTEDGFSVSPNRTLSIRDIDFIRKQYP